MSSLRIAKRQCDYLKIKPFRITMTLNKGILHIFVYSFVLQVIGIWNLRVFFIFIYLFILFWLCWVFVSVRGLSLVAASGGHSSSRCAGLSLSRPLLLRSTGSRHTGSVIAAHGPSCSAACGIFPEQGSNPCPLHWQADSQPLRHQGSPWGYFLIPPHIRSLQVGWLNNMMMS